MTRSSSPTSAPDYRIGEWLAQPALNRLRREERTISLEPRVMRVLVCLAERPGEVRTREELLEAVWGDVVVQEEALTHAISRLRRAFGDDARSARYIETIPKSGYRLIASVSSVPSSGEPPSPPAGGPGPRAAGTSSRTVPRAGAIAGALVLVLAVALLLTFGRGLWRSSPPSSPAILESVPLTSYPGEEITPAVSPDGTRVAFAWSGGEEGPTDIYVKQRDVETLLQLTATPADEHGPCWSPDGSRLAFVRDDGSTTSLHVVPALGGTARRVLEITGSNRIMGVDWHPDRERLAISTPFGEDRQWTLQWLVPKTGERLTIAKPPEDFGGDRNPVVSPNGELVAFVRRDRLWNNDLYVTTSQGGPVRRLTTGQGQIRGLDWTTDGEVIFSSGTAFAGEFRLWRVDVDTRELTWLPTRGRRSIFPSIASEAGVVVWAEETYHRHLAWTPIPDSGEATADPSPFVRSSHSEYDPHFSPSGEQVAFVSTRSGHAEIWVCDRDGENARRVTSFGGEHLEFIRWSRDERYLAYDVTSGSRVAVHVTDIEREVTKPLTRSTADEILLSWSRDGEHVYLRSLDDDGWVTLRASRETGETEEVFPFGAYMLAEADDGVSLLFAKPGTSCVSRATLDGVEQGVVFAAPDAVLDCYWKASPEGVFFYRSTDGGFQLAFHEFATGEIRALLPVPGVRWVLLDAALDGSCLLYDIVDRSEADLVLVERLPGSGS